jgi:hypothetical protein
MCVQFLLHTLNESNALELFVLGDMIGVPELEVNTFYGVILGLGIVLLIIIAVVAVYVQRQVKKNRSSK